MPSIDEATHIARKENPEDIANLFVSKGAKNIIIKLGSKGSYIRKANEKTGCVFPPYYVENPVDTTGAGDSFCSGFLAAFSRDESIDECMKFANATGAHCVMAKGATSGIKTYEEIKSFMGNGGKK